jgi:dipicolinate synthase subunit A
MEEFKAVAVLGGDKRQAVVAERLSEAGLSVTVFGLPRDMLREDIAFTSEWQLAIEGAQAVILPLPASPDSIRVSMPLVDGRAPLFRELFESLQGDVLLAGGKFSPSVKAMAEERGVRLFDYFESEELQQKNALPTAEGAVAILMREIPRTVSGLPVVVTGFGRVARALVRLLLAMGARVTVAARKKEDLRAAAALGCGVLQLAGEDALLSVCRGFAAIFNTVPYWLFHKRIVAALDPQTLLIDLASSPGGIDAAAAAKYGVRSVWALSLPGKYAPITAGEIIADTVLSYMRTEGIL